MISTPTVLVVGAGGSAHCGYPLGRQLVAQLCSDRYRNRQAHNGLPWSNEQIDEFTERLSLSDPDSIDTFLESNREHADLGKYLIARHLKQCEELSRLFPPADAGWYRTIYNALMVDGAPDYERSRLSIVTFNYDRSLEAYFFNRLQAQFRMSKTDAVQVLAGLPILHVHGTLGEYPAVTYGPATDTDDLISISLGIQIIYELVDLHDGFCNTTFERAHDLLTAAERIYFLGFGWHRDNLRRLRCFTKDTVSSRTVVGTAAGYGPLAREALMTALEEFGLSRIKLPNCSCNEFFEHAAQL